MACLIAVAIHIGGVVHPTSDSGVMVGLAANLRQHGSLTSPADPGWLLASPAESAARWGFVPIPDFAPVFPAIGAITPDPVHAFTVAELMSLFAVVVAIGVLILWATRSMFTTVLTQVVFVVGPTRVLPRFTVLDLAAFIQYDVVAIAFVLSGICALIVGLRGNARAAVGAGLLFTLGCLTRYAMLGVVIGIGVGLLLTRPPKRAVGHRSCVWACAAAVVATFAWIAGYQWWMSSGPAKVVRLHIDDTAKVGRSMIGWTGLPLNDTVGLVALAVVVGLGLAAAVWGPSVLIRTVGAALVGYLVVHLATRWFFDASYSVASERTMLPVRILALVLVVTWAFVLCSQFRRPWLPAAAMAIVLVIWTAGGLLSGFSVPDPSPSAAATTVNPRGLPVIADSADQMYLQLGVPVVGLPRSIESSTEERRAVRADTKALVAELRRRYLIVLVVVPPTLARGVVTQRDWPRCARPRTLPRIGTLERYELDLTNC